MLAERTSKILEAVVQGFIDTCEPISSGWLYRQYDFGIKPAMIRRELEELSRAKYLEQPYRSAGRIPRDRGYEFFANRLIEREEGSAFGADLAGLLKEGAFAEFFGEISDNFGLAGAVKLGQDIYKGGVENLVESFEWETAEEIKSVIRDFASIEERLERLTDRFFSAGLEVFVGKKSPITRSECLSVIAGNFDNDGEKISIFAIGPKRMDYKKAIKIFKGLQHAGRKRRK